MESQEAYLITKENKTPVHQGIVQCSENGKSNTEEVQVKSSSEDGNSKNPDEVMEKENDDGWEVVDESSDESDGSSNDNYDIIIPLKVIENGKMGVTSTEPVVSEKTVSKEDKVNSLSIGLNPIKDVHQSKQNVILNEKQSTITQPQKTKGKKRRFRLFTGDSSDEGVTTKVSANKNAQEKNNKSNENTQSTLPSQRHVSGETSTNPSACKHNATFTKENPTKFHSDTELSVHVNTSTEKKVYPSATTSSKVCDITEVESDEDVVEVPCSPRTNSMYHVIPSRKKVHSRDKSSHDSRCNSESLLASPNSRRSKRMKLMEQMWIERERKLKLKMVKKMKTVFYQVLESIVSSSDESEENSMSEDEDIHTRKMLRKRKQCNKQCCVTSHEAESVRDLKRELQYWKNKAKSGGEVLSPRELQIREMKEDLNYWKRVATSKSTLRDPPIPSQSHSYSLPRTSTPEKEDVFNDVSVPRPHEISRVTSSADVNTHNPRHAAQSTPAQYTNEVLFSTQDKQKSYKPPHSVDTSRALTVMTRTKFTEKEKDKIVEYLVSHYDQLEMLRGNMFWMQMAHDLETHRSWHSLKNNFFTNIIKNLEHYEMPKKVRNKIIGIAKQYM